MTIEWIDDTYEGDRHRIGGPTDFVANVGDFRVRVYRTSEGDWGCSIKASVGHGPPCATPDAAKTEALRLVADWLRRNLAAVEAHFTQENGQ